jgi:hypothetical protein
MNTKNLITILVVIHAEDALSMNILDGNNTYLFDNNRAGGSIGEGTHRLKTKVNGKQNECTIRWNSMSITPETLVEITEIQTDTNYMCVTECTYEDSDVTYWEGTIKKAFEELTCRLSIKIGCSDKEFLLDFKLIGDSSSRQIPDRNAK